MNGVNLKEHDDIISKAITSAKSLKEIAVADAKKQIMESLDSRVRSAVRYNILEGEDVFDGEDTVLQKEGEDVQMDAPSDEEIEEIMRELKEEEDSLEDEDYSMEEGEEPMEEGEESMDEYGDETSEDETMEEDEEVSDEDALEEILKIFNEGEDEPINLDDDEPMGDEPMEDDTEALEEAARTIVSLKRKLKEAYATIKSQTNSIGEINLLNQKMNYYTKLSERTNLSRNQKLSIIDILDRANTIKEVKIAYISLVEGIKQSAANKPRTNTVTPNNRTNSARVTTKQTNTIKESLRSKLRSKLKLNEFDTNIEDSNRISRTNKKVETNNSLRDKLRSKLNINESNNNRLSRTNNSYENVNNKPGEKLRSKFANDVTTRRRLGEDIVHKNEENDMNDVRDRFKKLSNIK